MIFEIALVVLTALHPSGGSDPQRLFVRVLDVECHPIPNISVAFFRVGDPPDRPALNAVTDSKGDAFLDVTLNSRYEVVASSPNFISARVGPFAVTKDRSSRPIFVVLNLSLDGGDFLPAPGPNLMEKRQ
jgi:hypothetical protein